MNQLVESALATAHVRAGLRKASVLAADLSARRRTTLMERAWGGATKRLQSRTVAHRRRWLSRSQRRMPHSDGLLWRGCRTCGAGSPALALLIHLGSEMRSKRF
jgi:hypothetical protein